MLDKIVYFMTKMGVALLIITWLVTSACVVGWLFINSPNWLFTVGSLLVAGGCAYPGYIFIDAFIKSFKD